MTRLKVAMLVLVASLFSATASADVDKVDKAIDSHSVAENKLSVESAKEFFYNGWVYCTSWLGLGDGTIVQNQNETAPVEVVEEDTAEVEAVTENGPKG